MERQFLRPTEAADVLGLGRTKTYNMIKAGELPSVRINGNVRVPMSLLNEWIQAKIGEATAAKTESKPVEAPPTVAPAKSHQAKGARRK